MRIAFAGTPEVALPTLAALQASEHELVGVITRPDAPSGRGKKLRPAPVAEFAVANDLPVYKPTNKAELAAAVDELAADLVIVVAFGMLLPADVLAKVPNGFVNLHFSLLPAWRGAAPVQCAIANGDEETGITTFLIVPALDAGPIYRQESYRILPGETAGELLERLAQLGPELVLKTIDDIAAGYCPAEQGESETSYAKRILPADVEIDWAKPGAQLVNMIRSANPNPTAWTMLDGQRVKILRAQLAAEPVAELAAGQIQLEKRRFLVGSGAGVVELIQLQPPGKKPMAAIDWARGHQLPGTFDGC